MRLPTGPAPAALAAALMLLLAVLLALVIARAALGAASPLLVGRPPSPRRHSQLAEQLEPQHPPGAGGAVGERLCARAHGLAGRAQGLVELAAGSGSSAERRAASALAAEFARLLEDGERQLEEGGAARAALFASVSRSVEALEAVYAHLLLESAHSSPVRARIARCDY